MVSNYKKFLTYDLETGGLKKEYCSITEIAMVTVDAKSLKVEDELSIVIEPYFDLRNIESDVKKEAKIIFNLIAELNEDTKKKEIIYKGERVTMLNLTPLFEDLKLFNSVIKEKYKEQNFILSLSDFETLEKNGYKDICEIYFSKCYTPGALAVTGNTRESLTRDGISKEEAFKKAKEYIESKKVGNKKPVRCGHNIGKFDDPVFKIFFDIFKTDFYDMFVPFVFDTLKFGHLCFDSSANYSLATCCGNFDIVLKDAHTAIFDTRANASLVIKILERLRGFGTSEKKYERKKYNFNF